MVRAVVAAFVAIVAIVAIVPTGGAAAAERARAERVVIVSYPRLDWATVLDARPPELMDVLEEAAVASLAVRTASAGTGLGDGYVSLGAGSSAAADPAVAGRAEDGVHAGIGAVEAAADDGLFGAEPGALGQAIADAGGTVAVIGNADVVARDGEATLPHREVVLAGMDRAGRVAAGRTDEGLNREAADVPGGYAMDVAAYTAAVDEALTRADVVIVEVSDLERAELAAGDRPVDRRAADLAALERGDDVLAAMQDRLGPDDLLLVVSPAAADDEATLTVFAARGGGLPPGGLARSSTTRRDGYVTLPDIAPTVLEALGLEVPDSMTGTPVVADGGDANDPAALHARVTDDERARFRDRALVPVTVVFVAAQVLLYPAAVLVLRRRRHLDSEGGRLPAPLALVGLTVMAFPLVCYLSGLVAYRDLGLAGYTLAVTVAAFGVALAVRTTARWHPVAPPLALTAATLGLLVIDVVTGAHLQLDTVFGYSATSAGRFTGFGNVAFAVVGATAMVVAAGQAAALAPESSVESAGDDPVRDRRLVIAAGVLGVAVLADGLAWFGADIGGALALIPASAVLLAVLARWRVSLRRGVAVAVGTLVVVAAFLALDLARDPDSRTHLGRFAARLVDGDIGLVVERKLRANWSMLTSSVWTLLVPVVVALVVVVVLRPGTPLAKLRRRVPGVDAGLAGAAVVAGLGLVLNDSGLAVPAMTVSIVVPWLLWMLSTPLVDRNHDRSAERPAAPGLLGRS